MIKFSALKQSAFATLGLSVLVILLTILGALFFYLTYTQVRSHNSSLEVTSALTAESVIEKVDRNFYERFGDVQAYAFNRLAIETAKNDSIAPGMQEFINTMTAYYVLYDLMLVVDVDGTPLAVNTKDKSGNNIPTGDFLTRRYQNEEWFLASVAGPAGGAWFSDFEIEPAIGKVYGTSGSGMAFAAPIRDTDGTIVGAWYNFASWKEVTEGIREEAEKNLQQDHPGAFIVITDSKGSVISAADGSSIGHTLKIDTAQQIREIYTDLTALQQDFIFGSAQGEGAYTYAGKKWIAVTFIPRETLSWGVFFSKQNMFAVIICLVVVVIVGIYIYLSFRKRIISRIQDIGSLQQRLSEGEILDVNLADKKEDEFGRMKGSLASLAGALKQKSSFADEISKGNLDAELKTLSGKDVLGNSLINMRNQLRVARENDRQRNWAAEGIAQIGEITRSYKSLDQLCHDIIKFVVTYTRSNQGGLFLISDDEDTKVLKLASCYAYDKRRFIDKTLGLDQGLVGQCLQERSTIYLKVVPKDYISITSGLGGANPKTVLIVPLKTNEEIYGALELASFKEFEPYQIALVEKLAETIGASIASISGGEKTRELLAQMQQQTEEMKSQEEEMRQNMEELSATQEEMLRKEREYLSKIKILEEK